MLQSTLTLLLMIGAFALQYYLVRKPQKWLSLLLPCVFVGLAAYNAVMSAQSGESIFSSPLATGLFVFVVSNMNTVLLGVIYLKRNSSVASTMGAVAFSWIAMLLLYFAAMFVLSSVLT